VERVDVVVIGGGIVGLATARALSSRGVTVVVLEKEAAVATHQSGRNSGVLHSGIYYRPSSLKAETVRAGREAMLQLCIEHDIAHEVPGKLIVATAADELDRLEALETRAREQEIPVERLGPDGLRDVEPHAAGIAALRVPSAGLVDFPAVARAMASELDVRLSAAVTSIVGRRVETTAGTFAAKRIVSCAGLQSDRVARMTGAPDTGVRIVPFRGEYHDVVGVSRELVRNLIYPVPDPAFPFLGVHLTRSLDGRVHAGPNAVLALAREGYTWRTARVADLVAMARHRGTWQVARRHWRTGVGEVHRSLRRSELARALRRLVPDLDTGDLVPAPAGVRAQAVDRDGNLLDDFVIEETETAVNVVNAPSPAATASLEIGNRVSARVLAGLAS
jgi:L-2-hydroxyglutarate oxidase